jgi:hypothetical protein
MTTPPEGPDREALAEYLASMDRAGGGIYTADFRDGFRHALAMLAAQESGGEREPVREAAREALARQAALLPTPPAPGGEPERCARHGMVDCACERAPGDGEGLRAEVERLRDKWDAMTVVGLIRHEVVVALDAALAARDTDQGAGALGALVDRWRPITPTYHAVVAGEHLAACIACLMVAELDEVLPR